MEFPSQISRARRVLRFWLLLGLISLSPSLLHAAAEAEWEQVLALARKEGKAVVAIPPSAELRKQLEAVFKQRFGIELEVVPAPGPVNANRIASEYKAGVRYFDALIVGTGTAEPLAAAGTLEPMEAFWLLPEVQEPKRWWGGHIWEDNLTTKRFLYSFIAEVGTGGLWYNADLVKAEELRSFDDFLQPKFKGRIGFSDPRVPGSGQSLWSFLWEIKGEGFLHKLVQHDLFLSRDLRQIGDALAKGKVVVSVGVGYSQLEPFLKSGLPLRQLPPPKEGLPASNGFGVLGVVKNPPHPNAAKILVNWLLSREGQDFYGKVMRHATRRLDVETKWLVDQGVQPAKDYITLEEYHRVRNHLEDKYTRVRVPASAFAEKILK